VKPPIRDLLVVFLTIALLRWLVSMYVLDGRKWSTKRCEMSLGNTSSASNWEDTFRRDAMEWNRVTTGLSLVENPGGRDGLASYDLGRLGGRLGITYIQPRTPNSNLYEVQVLVNTFWAWDPPHPLYPGRDTTGNSYILETLLLHELGHALWLGHNHDDPSCIMYPTVPPNTAKGLGSDDDAGMRALYP